MRLYRKTDPTTPMGRAIAAVGSGYKLAQLLTAKGAPIRPQAIYQWDRVPADRCAMVSELTGIPKHELRPDLFDPPDKSAPRRAARPQTVAERA
jgi:DNA-binding transcriptional regulator YdaS (Cro superfamily)